MTLPPNTAFTARQRRILAWIEEKGYATIESLAEHLGVSMQTVRREIILLDASGHLQRFHGGAGLAGGEVRLGYREKNEVSRDAKQSIAAAAAARIADGASVFLDVGTTVEAVARALAGRPDLHIVTSSINCAGCFRDNPTTSVFVTGGIVRGADGSLIGDAARSALERFKVDIAVIGCSAVEADGAVMDYDLDKIAVKQMALSNARRAFLVADSRKFNRNAVARIAAISDFHLLITDRPPPAEVLGRLGECKTVIAA